jgi:hypothetical protein
MNKDFLAYQFIKSCNLPTFLLKFALIIVFSLIGGLILPGIISYYEGVFYASQIKNRLNGEALTRLQEYETYKKKLEERIGQIDFLLIDSSAEENKSANVSSLITLKNQYQNELKSLKPPILVNGFYFNRLMLVWPIFYICLGVLNFLMAPKESDSKSFWAKAKGVLIILLILVPLYRWPTWMRNAFFNAEGRVVYGGANFDISPIGFIIQELQALAVAFLIALLWYRWLSFYSSRREQLMKELTNSNRNILNEVFDPFKFQRISTDFFHWQISSIFLAVAFIGYTAYFWHNVIVADDKRYLVHAIIMHSMWIVSWVIISMPLFITWYAWYSLRAGAVSALASEPILKNTDREIALKALQELQPVGVLYLTISFIGTAVTFISPIIQALFK